MKGTRAAQRYAKAILELANDKKVAKDVKEDMLSISKTIENSEDLRSTLASPVIKPSLKNQILKAIFKDVNGLTTGVFNLLVENNRINILDVVAKQYLSLFDTSILVQNAVVTTVVPLTKELEVKIQAKIKELTGREATIENKIDESILGGFVLRVGDLQYDASVANNLNNLKTEFKTGNNAYVSKI
ncbi:MAG: ATP synthase F1 subunit delta [Zunongwangia sp.]|jgi:F-type H+-transporting ATPase subunit delta|uniref:ATP synthase subunit delta n=1 Tax=Zunongwangia profunda TaxID=398743 RepID=A0A3D5J0F9_9FLAO|nr:ATP synthase F1 subunit delta [Zunongwangia profunda]MAO37214.1 ATP synthase F1 subunit delta [Zunongwangia sp.]MAS70659.1 ATP synthase F1 subunit delta [Zunongwangia sp.]HAJ82472.1 ATP synthase F1 subunit delta [Zunongwangia profunda]HCV81477.1 ATP synthase F1 subunit delta [Zunongwangia profunda]|tara:strand:+ start:77 stop:637 length:561 start_codon:yes stop_codon:yes gene_type:complete